MRRSSTKTERPSAGKGSAGGRAATVLGTPAITSCGLFHQQASRSSGSNTATTGESSRYANGDPNNTNNSSHNNDSNALLLVERHTSAAKDGLIDMLTDKASTLGASLERVMVGKKEVEDRLDRLQRVFEEETAKRKGLEERLLRGEEHDVVAAKEKERLRYEVDSLQRSLRDVEERSRGWAQEESDRRRSVEEALAREHAVAMEYLESVYREGDGPSLGKDGGPTAEVLVQELHALGGELRERDSELRTLSERLDDTAGELKAERERSETMRNQLVFTQERFEVSKRKGRQVTGQLEVEIGDNRALREQLHSLTAGMERRTKANEERKVKAQQRKRGDTRDMMAESKAKDDRIKSLESNLMQEKARLEEELRAARADYEEAAKESRRKTGRLQRRCLELEYRVAMQTKAGLAESGGVISREGAVKGAVNTTAAASSETSGSSLKTVPGFLLSTASVLPWRRGSMSSETSSTSGPATAGSAAPTPLAAAAAVGGPTPATAGGGRRATAVAAAIAAAGGGGGGGRGGGRGERGIPASGAAPTHPGRRSADRLPDPSRHNDSAPAWMRADLAVDTVHED